MYEYIRKRIENATKLDKEAAAKKAKDAEIKTPAKPKVDRSIAGRQKRDRERMGRGGLAEGVSKEDGDRARAQMQAPQVKGIAQFVMDNIATYFHIGFKSFKYLMEIKMSIFE